MPERTPGQRLERLVARAGPHVSAFAEYLAGEFCERTVRTALDQGFSLGEAKEITLAAAAGAMKAYASASQQARFDRQFTRK